MAVSGDAERLERTSALRRGGDVPARFAVARHAPALVRVDHQLESGPDRVAYGFDDRHVVAPVRMVEADLHGANAGVAQRKRVFVAVVPSATCADPRCDPDVGLDPVPPQIRHPGTALLAEPVPTSHRLSAPTAELPGTMAVAPASESLDHGPPAGTTLPSQRSSLRR